MDVLCPILALNKRGGQIRGAPAGSWQAAAFSAQAEHEPEMPGVLPKQDPDKEAGMDPTPDGAPGADTVSRNASW